MKKKFMYILLTIISSLFMIMSVINDNIIYAFLGLMFYFILLTLFHELGHALFCVINKNKITRIFVCFFMIKDKRIYFANYFRFQSFCAFIKKKNNSIIYLGGPIISLIITLLLFTFYVLTRKIVILFYFIISIIYTIINTIPYGKSDINSYIDERRKVK